MVPRVLESDLKRSGRYCGFVEVCGQFTDKPPTSWSTSVHFRQLDTETRPAVRTAEGTAAMPSWDNLDYYYICRMKLRYVLYCG